MPGIINRFFIPLIQDRLEYTLKDRQAFGKCIIEYSGNLGKLSATVQDLKPEVLYKLYLISSIDGTKVCVGTVAIDGRGKGGLKWEFDPKNTGESNEDIGHFDVAAVVVPRDNEVISPLVGYRNEPVMWKNIFFSSPKKQAEEDAPEDTEVAETADAHVGNIIAGDEISAPAQDSSDEEQIDEEQIEEADGISNDVTDAEADVSVNTTTETDILKAAKEQGLYSLEIQEIIKDIAQTFTARKCGLDLLFETKPKTKPFLKQNRDVVWIQIAIQDLQNLFENHRVSLEDQFVINAEKKYKHLILGRYSELGRYHYILGIPDVYDPVQSREIIRKGYVQFKCYESLSPKPGEPGYFLLPL